MENSDLQQALPVGTILKSPKFDYRVEEVLGKGGFGITYKVSTTVMFDKVPIFTYFTIKEHFLKDACERGSDSHSVGFSNPLKSRVEESRADFLSEARRLNSISGKNQNVVPVSEVFEANNTVYYVMEYLNGGNLRDLVASGGPLGEKQALEIIRPVAEAVSFLHGYKINHLDIKPDNVMFRMDYHTGVKMPVLIDFGLAKHFDSSGKPTSAIRVQGCSDGYAPVEQYSGLNTFSPQADVYALGATLYYMLVGKTPVIATELQSGMIDKGLPPTVSDATRAAIVRAMAYSKYDRTVSVADFIADLSGKAEKPAPVPPPTPAPVSASTSGPETKVLDKPLPPPVSSGGGGSQTEVIRSGSAPKKWIKPVGIGVVVAAVIAAAVIWLLPKIDDGGGGGIDWESVYAAYVSECDRCSSMIAAADASNPDSLLEAKDMLSSVKDTESEYAGLNDNYAFDRSAAMDKDLAPKLQEAHDAWVAAAEAQISEVGDNAQALEYYRTAYKFVSDSLTAMMIGDLEGRVNSGY